jgi:predicted transposase YbfD/YdcC
MPETESVAFHDCFRCVEDPRIERSKRHLLTDILFLSVCATIAGADGPSDIEAFGKEKIQWLRRFLQLPGGIPSHDTVGRVIALIKPSQFQQAFLTWIEALFPETLDGSQPEFIPLDGKTLRRSHNRKLHQNPLHLVSAWSAKNRLTLGQVAVDQKSNEITAIPKLLEMLELRGAIVSIDAMGCQTEIAQQIIAGQGDYVLAVKDNQPTLAAAIEAAFLNMHETDFQDAGCRQHTTQEKSRGRHETRYYCIAPVPASMAEFRDQWTGLRSIGQVVTINERDGKPASEVRYYISSLSAKVKTFAASVRSHWSIENSLHWVLDMTFAEDASRIRAGHGTENFGFLRRFVISLLNRDTSQDSLRRKRKRAGWSTTFLENVLFPSD